MPKNSEARSSTSSQIRDSYDAVYQAEEAGLSKLRTDQWPRNRWEATIASVPQKAGKVLEIGCGNGIVLFNIAEHCDSLTGVEVSDNRCATARINLSGLDTPVDIIQGNVEEGLELPDASFDVILWADVIEHVVDVFAAMKEVSRLLVPGGMLVTSTPNMAYARYRLALLRGKFPGTASQDEGFAVRPGEMYDGGHLHYLTINTLKRLYQLNGIEPTRTIGFGRLGKIHNFWPSLLSGAAHIEGIKS
jgi:2-polyprenyl-3-methyl-5-hydroxy-6-metoxy-1,4-benzoquinol methylase